MGSQGATSMPSGAAPSLTDAMAFDAAVAAPAGPGKAAPAATATTSAAPTPAHATSFRLRQNGLPTVTVNPPFTMLRKRYSLNRSNPPMYEERQHCNRESQQGLRQRVNAPSQALLILQIRNTPPVSSPSGA